MTTPKTQQSQVCDIHAAAESYFRLLMGMHSDIKQLWVCGLFLTVSIGVLGQLVLSLRYPAVSGSGAALAVEFFVFVVWCLGAKWLLDDIKSAILSYDLSGKSLCELKKDKTLLTASVQGNDVMLTASMVKNRIGMGTFTLSMIPYGVLCALNIGLVAIALYLFLSNAQGTGVDYESAFFTAILWGAGVSFASYITLKTVLEPYGKWERVHSKTLEKVALHNNDMIMV